jgi:hypothetical protein
MMQRGAVNLQYISIDEQIANHPRHDAEGGSEVPVHIHR